MPTVLELLQNEKTGKLIQGVVQLAGSFLMQQMSGEDDIERHKKIADKYYAEASKIAESTKGPALKSSEIEPLRLQEIPDVPEPEIPDISEPDENERGVSVRDSKTEACAACTRNHVAAAAGLLAEGKRFLEAGLTSPEVLDRINLATQELTTAERGDLNPAKIQRLPNDERELATWMASQVREMRHVMDRIKSKEDYMDAIAKLSDFSREITKRYYMMMESISPEKEFAAMKKLCNERPESEREKCMETMTQILK